METVALLDFQFIDCRLKTTRISLALIPVAGRTAGIKIRREKGYLSLLLRIT